MWAESGRERRGWEGGAIGASCKLCAHKRPRKPVRFADEPWHTAGLTKPTSSEQMAVARSTTRLRRTMDRVRAGATTSAPAEATGTPPLEGFPPSDKPAASSHGLGPWLTSRTAPAPHSGRRSERLAATNPLAGVVQPGFASTRQRQGLAKSSRARRDRPQTAGPRSRSQAASQHACLGVFARALTATEAQEHRQRFRNAKPSMGMPVGKLTRTAQSWADPEALALSVKPALGSGLRRGRTPKHPERQASRVATEAGTMDLPRISLDFSGDPLLAGAERATPSSSGTHNVRAFLESAVSPLEPRPAPARRTLESLARARAGGAPAQPGSQGHKQGAAKLRRRPGSEHETPRANAASVGRAHSAAAPGRADLTLAPEGTSLRPASALRSNQQPQTSPVDSAEDCLFHHHGVGAFRRGVLAVSSPETVAAPSALSTIGNTNTAAEDVRAASGYAVTGYFAVRVNSRTALMHSQRRQAKQARRLEQMERSRITPRQVRLPVGGANSRLPLGPSF